MELREYARVVWRYVWIILALPVVVGVASWVLRPAPPRQYVATVRFTIGVNAPSAKEVTGYDPVLTSYQASEYIRDDFAEIIQSDMFADGVNAQLAKMGAGDIKVSKGNISGAIEKQRRLMSLTVVWNDRDQAQKIVEAAVNNLKENNSKYFAQLGSSPASLTVIDTPVVNPAGISLREQLDIPIRIALAFLAGIALAFIFDYLDTSIRDARDAEAMGLRIIAEIPSARRRFS